MPLPAEIGDRLVEADPAAAATLDAVENLVDSGALGEPPQLDDEILLQRLALTLGTAPKPGVHFLWEVSHKHVGHACIMLSPTRIGIKDDAVRTGDPSRWAIMRADSHFMLAFEGFEVPDEVLGTLGAGGVPGVSLFRFANVDTATQVAELTTSLEKASGAELPLLIAADQETGQLVGLGGDTTQFPGAMALGATGDTGLATRVAAAVGTELRALGVTMNYAPVCDVATNPANPSLGIRAFSDDPAVVAAMAAATVDGLRSAGVAAVAKHFPGKGEAVIDPHHGLPLLDLDRQRLETVELAPFRAVIAAGVPVAMSGHYAVPAVTGRSDLPSTVSEAMLGGLLRTDLGFEGVIITDALDMHALPQGVGQIVDAISALRAGVDLLLCAPDAEARERLRTGLDLAVSRGLIPATLTSSTKTRVDQVRRWVASFARPELSVVGCRDHQTLAAEAARRSITLVRDESGLLPLPTSGRILAVMPEPIDLTPADTSSTVTPTLAASLRRRHPDVVEVVTGHRPSPADISGVVEAAISVHAVVIGTLAAGPEQSALVRAVAAAGTPIVTVAMRTPFDLASYPDVGTHLCTYSIHRHSMEALADVLFGHADAEGRLPAAIPGLYPTGHRLDP